MDAVVSKRKFSISENGGYVDRSLHIHEKYHRLSQNKSLTTPKYPVSFFLQKECKKVKAEMLPETRAILSEFFHSFNEKLVELTGDERFLWEDTV